MFDLIVMYIEDGLIALMAVVAYLCLVVSVYPRLTLRTVWRARRQQGLLMDRGVRKLTFPGGRAVIYRPAIRSRRFLRSYALIKQDGCTYIRCRVHDAVSHIRYEVAAFDKHGRLLDVLQICELIAEPGYTRAVRLPRDTAYACVTLRKADAMYEGRRATLGYSLIGMAVYTALTVVTTMAAAWLLRSSFSEILASIPLDRLISVEGTVFSEIRVAGLGTTLTVSALLGLGTAAWGLLMYHIHASKVMNR